MSTRQDRLVDGRADLDGRRDAEGVQAPAPFLSGPATGRQLRAFSLPGSRGEVVQLIDYKQRSNVLLVLFHGVNCAACRTFLRALGDHTAHFADVETAVLAISPDTAENLSHLAHELRLPFPLLSDPAGQVAGREALDIPAVVIADRFGEIWAAWRAGDQHAFPAVTSMDDWLQLIELQCRECEAPEWPAVPMRVEDTTAS